MKKSNIIKSFLALSLTALSFTACLDGTAPKQEWTSFIYPDKQNLKRSTKNGIYESLNLCKQASIEKLISMNLSKNGFYKCGLGCEYHEGMKTEICKRMEK